MGHESCIEIGESVVNGKVISKDIMVKDLFGKDRLISITTHEYLPLHEEQSRFLTVEDLDDIEAICNEIHSVSEEVILGLES